MPLTSSITAYDPSWPKQYAMEERKLLGLFDRFLTHIHHVGSTAVPHLSAKPEIDILIIVLNIDGASEWDTRLAEVGYKRGADLSVGHLFYKRDINGIRTHKLHVCRENHSQINRMLLFRDSLRRDKELCEQYAALKSQLAETNTGGIKEYLAGKAPFIEQVLAQCGKH